MKRIVFAALLLLAASSALAGEILIPVAYRGPGAFNTNWRTDITVSNTTTTLQLEAVPVTITFHRDNGENLSIDMPLVPMEVVSVTDAVYQWWSVETGSGIVRVTWDVPDAQIAAHARIYTAGEHGEYGQAVPGVETSRLVTDHFLPGITGVDGNRTNVGISNPSTVGTGVWVELFDTSGRSRGSFSTYVPARSFRQINDIFSAFQAGPLHAAMVRVTAMDAPVYAYASIVRNDSGDATFLRQP